MDEILSSIRQIIADDDASGTESHVPELSDSEIANAERSLQSAIESALEGEPLALSPEQILSADAEAFEAIDFGDVVAEGDQHEVSLEAEPGLMDAEDIAFTSPKIGEELATSAPDMLLAATTAISPAQETPASFQQAAEPTSFRPRPTLAQAAPMPDPKLSTAIAEELLEPATNSVVRANFAKLNNFGLGNSGLTIESLMRDMLRPMLKDWLDEHLPALVERMVEKEISRISRGFD